MRVHLATLISAAVFACSPAIAQEDSAESRIIKKIEVLGGTVERDKNHPDHPVVKVSIKGSKRFTGKHLHLLKGFTHLKDVDLGDLFFTDGDVQELWQPEVLAKLLMDANENQLKGIMPKLGTFREIGLQIWNAELDLKPLSPETPTSDPRRERRAGRQANAAIALLITNQSEKVWPLLKHSSDPRVRSYLIHRFAPFGVDADVIIKQLNHESDITIRRALVLSLGQFDEKGLREAACDQLLPKLQEIYRDGSDAGLHSAVESLLIKWEQVEWLKRTNQEWSANEAWKERLKNVEETLAEQSNKAPLWYVNSQIQTMIVIPGPVEFSMGSPESEVGHQKRERQHRRRIERNFALSATIVTIEQYRQFEKGYGQEFDSAWASQTNLPAIFISWYMGARYCNWLSQQEKLEPCYEIDGGEMSLKENYLGLSGYRFPTEAEIEYATRAGTITSRYFGETDSLLSNYAWYETNSLNLPQPVGLLHPNDFGFFDTHGNGWCWCQDRYVDYPEGDDSVDDKEDTESLVKVDVPRIMRGGAFDSQASSVRSATRIGFLPTKGFANIGSFRIAKSLPLVTGGNRTPGECGGVWEH